MKTKVLLLSIVIGSTLQAKIDTLFAESEITDVTVFFNGAQVTRTIDVDMEQGKHYIYLKNLPLEINGSSVQVKSADGCKILSVKHLIEYDNHRESPVAKKIKKEIETMEEEAEFHKSEMNVFDLEEELLLNNSDFGNNRAGTNIAEIREAADFYRQRINEIRKAKFQLRAKLKNLQEHIDDKNEKLNALMTNSKGKFSSVFVALDCEKRISKALKLTYYLETAGWEPIYDFRVEQVNEPMNIVYNANVFQSTGEDWKGVDVTLSTSLPALSGAMPELRRWYLSNRSPYQIKERKSGTGAVKGKVYDEETGEAIPLANVIVKKNGEIINGAAANFDGIYTIKPVPEGLCQLEFSYIGYATQPVRIDFKADNLEYLDVSLRKEQEILEDVEVIFYEKPLIEKDITGATYSKSDIQGYRSGGGINVRGSRDHATDVYIDGMKVRGSTNVPRRQISSLASTTAGVYQSDGGYAKISSDYIANTIQHNVVNMEYRIDIPYTILSDGEDYQITIKEVLLDVNYLYHIVPKVDKDAFLLAEIGDWASLNLLSGKSSLYYKGTFVGESYLDMEKLEDTLTISLGRDRNIQVKREADMEINDRRVFGNNIKETLGWDIIVKNNSTAQVKIVVEDQFPLSARKSVEVERISYEGARLDEKTGILEWEFELNPSQKKEVNFKYSVKYPYHLDLVVD